MKKYISHFSAANKWNIPYLNIVFDAELKKTNSPIHNQNFTVSNRFMSNDTKGCIVHSCELDLPRSALRKCGTDYVTSPEYTFLQLANYLDLHRLILLGIGLCAHSPGKPGEAISSLRKLREFLTSTVGFNGHKKAMRALQYVRSGSASPMESLSYMLLVLPNSLGGYGLSGVEFNKEITLDDKSRSILKQNRCFADIYYSSAKIDVEYDSEEHHNESDILNENMLRATILENMGIEVVRLGKSQVYDKRAFHKFAQNLAKKLNKRVRIRNKNFYKMNMYLRKLLYTN